MWLWLLAEPISPQDTHLRGPVIITGLYCLCQGTFSTGSRAHTHTQTARIDVQLLNTNAHMHAQHGRTKHAFLHTQAHTAHLEHKDTDVSPKGL